MIGRPNRFLLTTCCKPMFIFKEEIVLKNGSKVSVRMLTKEDEDALYDFFQKLSEKSLFFRFLSYRKPPDKDEVKDLIYSEDTFAVGAFTKLSNEEILVGEARCFVEGQIGEVCAIVLDDWQGLGLGTLLMNKVIKECKIKGLRALVCYIHSENTPAYNMVERLGFKLKWEDPSCLKGILRLNYKES